VQAVSEEDKSAEVGAVRRKIVNLVSFCLHTAEIKGFTAQSPETDLVKKETEPFFCGRICAGFNGLTDIVPGSVFFQERHEVAFAVDLMGKQPHATFQAFHTVPPSGDSG